MECLRAFPAHLQSISKGWDSSRVHRVAHILGGHGADLIRKNLQLTPQQGNAHKFVISQNAAGITHEIQFFVTKAGKKRLIVGSLTKRHGITPWGVFVE